MSSTLQFHSICIQFFESSKKKLWSNFNRHLGHNELFGCITVKSNWSDHQHKKKKQFKLHFFTLFFKLICIYFPSDGIKAFKRFILKSFESQNEIKLLWIIWWKPHYCIPNFRHYDPVLLGNFTQTTFRIEKKNIFSQGSILWHYHKAKFNYNRYYSLNRKCLKQNKKVHQLQVAWNSIKNVAT